METEKEIKQLEEDLKNLEVKEISLAWRIVMLLLIVGFILFSLWIVLSILFIVD